MASLTRNSPALATGTGALYNAVLTLPYSIQIWLIEAIFRRLIIFQAVGGTLRRSYNRLYRVMKPETAQHDTYVAYRSVLTSVFMGVISNSIITCDAALGNSRCRANSFSGSKLHIGNIN